jgi:hypothetical protein
MWCDRLSCKEHAQDPHNCEKFKGAVEPEAVGEYDLRLARAVVELIRLEEDFGSGVADESDGSAPVCRGCRERPSGPTFNGLCRSCLIARRCGNTRTNALNGRHMTCIRPAGHQPPCEEGHPDGSQWVPDRPTWVNAIEPVDSGEPAPVAAELEAMPFRWLINPALIFPHLPPAAPDRRDVVVGFDDSHTLSFAELQQAQGVSGRVDPDSMRIPGLALGVDVSSDGSATVAIASLDSDGRMRVEVVAPHVDAALQPDPSRVGARLRDAAAEGIELGPIGRMLLAQADRDEVDGPPLLDTRFRRVAGTATVDLAGCNHRLDAFFGEVLYCGEEPDHDGPHRRGSTSWSEIGECLNDRDIETRPARPWWRLGWWR